MIALIFIKTFLIILAGLFNACMDVLSKNRYFDSIFVKWKFFKKYQNFLNPLTSASNKWKNGDKAQGERFFGSSRWFVLFTDAWHLFGLLFRSFYAKAYICVGMLISINIWYSFGALVVYIIFTTTFHIFHTYKILK